MPDPDRDTAAEDTGTGHTRVPVRIEEALGAAALGAICLISLGNVIVRYATNMSFGFTEEFSVFLLVFMTFVGASVAFAANQHIRITFFRDRLPAPLRWLADLVTLIVTLAMFGLIAYYGALVSYDEWKWGETTPGLGYPSWIYTIWLPILAGAIILRVLGRGWARLLRPGPWRG
jgi:TRAP-type transport system small permease protein